MNRQKSIGSCGVVIVLKEEGRRPGWARKKDEIENGWKASGKAATTKRIRGTTGVKQKIGEVDYEGATMD